VVWISNYQSEAVNLINSVINNTKPHKLTV